MEDPQEPFLKYLASLGEDVLLQIPAIQPEEVARVLTNAFRSVNFDTRLDAMKVAIWLLEVMPESVHEQLVSAFLESHGALLPKWSAVSIEGRQLLLAVLHKINLDSIKDKALHLLLIGLHCILTMEFLTIEDLIQYSWAIVKGLKRDEPVAAVAGIYFFRRAPGLIDTVQHLLLTSLDNRVLGQILPGLKVLVSEENYKLWDKDPVPFFEALLRLLRNNSVNSDNKIKALDLFNEVALSTLVIPSLPPKLIEAYIECFMVVLKDAEKNGSISKPVSKPIRLFPIVIRGRGIDQESDED